MVSLIKIIWQHHETLKEVFRIETKTYKLWDKNPILNKVIQGKKGSSFFPLFVFDPLSPR